MSTAMKKSFQECFQSVSVQSHYFLVAQTVHIRRELVAENDDRCGQIAATVTSENVPRLESLIMKAPQMTYTEIQVIMKISLGGLTIILHHCFGVRKRCVGWVPHSLSEEHMWTRAPTCVEYLTEEGLLPSGTLKQDTKPGYSNTTSRQSNSRRCGSSQIRNHL